jgi:hypothetical protein
MGLAERRAASEFEATHYPPLKKKIDEAAGFAVDIEVKWNTLSKDQNSKYVTQWADAWPKIYFAPIIEAFKLIARDQMGKDALKAALKKIVIQDDKKSYESSWAVFDSGTLTLDYMFTNVSDVKARTEYLVKELEKKL